MKAYLWTTTDGKLAEPFMGVRNAGKVRNRRVEKSSIVLILVKKFIPQ